MKKNNKIKIGLLSIIFILLILIMVFLANTEWRGKVQSFFGAEKKTGENQKENSEKTKKKEDKKESEKPVSGSIKDLGREKISDAAETEYYELDGLNGDYEVCSVLQDILILKGDEGKVYYKLQSGKAEKTDVSYTHAEDTVELYGKEYPMELQYAMLGEEMILEDTSDHRETDDSLSVEGQYKGEWVWLHQGRQNDPYHDILYNVKTGETRDIVKEILGDIPDITFFERSPDENYAIVMTKDTTYLLDLEKKEGTSLQKRMGLEGKLFCGFIDETLLYVSQISEEAEKLMEQGKPYEQEARTYNYNMETGELRAYSDQYQKYKEKSGIHLRQDFYLYIEKEGKNYVLLTPDEKRYLMEGLDNNNISFKLSSDRKKLIAAAKPGEEESGIKANEAGVIDLEKKEMKIFQMEGLEEDLTTQLTWTDNCIVILKGDGKGVFIYRFD